MARPTQVLGDRVLRPFLQDTILFWPLTAAMAGTLLAAPLTIARVLWQARPTLLPFFAICTRACVIWTSTCCRLASMVWHTCILR